VEDDEARVWLERVERETVGKGGAFFYRPKLPKGIWRTSFGAEKVSTQNGQGCPPRMDGGVHLGWTGVSTQNGHTTPENTPENTPLTTQVSFLPSEVERLWELAGEHLHLTGKATDKDRTTLHHLLSEGTYKPEQIERAIIGLRLAIEDGVFEGFVEPGEGVSLGFLLRGKKNNRAVWAVADDYFREKAR
jgi:hypothetical protein